MLFRMFGALLGTYMRGLSNDIYFQIALVGVLILDTEAAAEPITQLG